MIYTICDLLPISQYQYLSKNKRYVSKRGKEWSKEICSQLLKQKEENKWEMLESENIECEILFYFNNRRKNDLDNACKYILDKLSDCKIIKEDRYITKLVLEKEYKKINKERIIIKLKDRDIK